MKALAVRIFMSLFLALPVSAQDLTLRGTIGPYPVEMILFEGFPGDAAAMGRYKYQSQKAWLDLNGEAYLDVPFTGQAAFALEESFKGDPTGELLLERSDAGLVGQWIGPDKVLPVTLTADEESVDDFLTGFREEIFVDAGRVEGAYSVRYTWINDLFAPKTTNLGSMADRSMSGKLAPSRSRSISNS